MAWHEHANGWLLYDDENEKHPSVVAENRNGDKRLFSTWESAKQFAERNKGDE